MDQKTTNQTNHQTNHQTIKREANIKLTVQTNQLTMDHETTIKPITKP
jgi:hypothetical protein